jgi:purine catabolism regulator
VRDFRTVSIGYTAALGGAAGVRKTLIEARHALSVGERLRGPGHASSYAEVALEEFLVTAHEPLSLQVLRDSVLRPVLSSDQSPRNELVETLKTHLETGCRTVQSAELLGVHRNSVLYRLKRITELLHVDLEDADTRLLLQLAMRAGAAIAADPPRASL